MNSSHSLSCPCYSGVTIALLHPINKPLNHLHRARDFNFICICCDFCHHLQGVESCHDSSCLQVGRDFDLILTKILPWGQACTVQWGRALHGDAKASHHPGSGHCQVEPPSQRAKQLTLPHTAFSLSLLPPVLSVPGHTGVLSVSFTPFTLSAFRVGTLKCSQVVCQHLVWYKWLSN